MAERQLYIYQDQEYDLPAGLTKQQALERIKKYLSENAETVPTPEPEPDVEPSGATGFEETAFDVRQATEQPPNITDIISDVFDTDNILNFITEKYKFDAASKEGATGIGATVAYETAAAIPKIAYNVTTLVAPETMTAIK